jgi:hypothetical protein
MSERAYTRGKLPIEKQYSPLAIKLNTTVARLNTIITP